MYISIIVVFEENRLNIQTLGWIDSFIDSSIELCVFFLDLHDASAD